MEPMSRTVAPPAQRSPFSKQLRQAGALGPVTLSTMLRSTPQLVYIAERAITCEECARYIKTAEQQAWHDARFNSNTHLEIDTSPLWEAMTRVLPPSVMDMDLDGLIVEHNTCVKYVAGQGVRVHCDQPHIDDKGRVVLFVGVLYLNDDYSGGETVFPTEHMEVSPKTGTLALFPPVLPHATRTIRTGVKYILRTEVLYRVRETDEWERCRNGIPS
jgi:prolyl 4-hydroxylase